MSYVVLARKHRPQSFKDVIGQEHITEILQKSIKANRIAHSYLFCGPRGVGKTTCARILSMCLNCEDGPKVNPPQDSLICQEISKGTSFDVIEIDGASNRGIDEIRTIRENVKFAPTQGRFKIYIIDEVHMLTTEAFNALLKTLEEPPEHVKFMFATTEPNKVPPTIISRCQRFDFKRIGLKTIVELLTEVSKRENFKTDEDALYAIAKAAQGSMRDALSILDQLSALTDKGIRSEDVFSMLGLVETDYLFEVSQKISEKNCVASLEVLNKIIDQGKDVKQLTKDLTEHFRNLMIIKVGGKSLGKLVDYPIAIKELYLNQSAHFSLKDILLAIETFIEVQDTARITESTRMPLEVALAKLTYQDLPAEHKSEMATPQPKSTMAQRVSPKQMLQNNKGQVGVSNSNEDFVTKPFEAQEVEDVEDTENVENVENESVVINFDKISRRWDGLTFAVSKEKMSVATYLQEGTPVSYNNEVLVVGFPKNKKFQKEALEDQANLKLVEKIFEQVFKASVRIKYQMVDDYQPKEEESNVQDVLKTFEGKVVSRWHNE